MEIKLKLNSLIFFAEVERDICFRSRKSQKNWKSFSLMWSEKSRKKVFLVGNSIESFRRVKEKLLADNIVSVSSFLKSPSRYFEGADFPQLNLCFCDHSRFPLTSRSNDDKFFMLRDYSHHHFSDS